MSLCAVDFTVNLSLRRTGSFFARYGSRHAVKGSRLGPKVQSDSNGDSRNPLGCSGNTACRRSGGGTAPRIFSAVIARCSRKDRGGAPCHEV